MWSVALAQPPGTIRPVITSVDAPEKFIQWQTDSGIETPSDLACEPLLEGEALLCLRLWRGAKRHWVSKQDLAEWGTTYSDVRQSLEGEIQSPADFGLERKKVADMASYYWLLSHGDGNVAQAMMAPSQLSRVLGEKPFLASVPAEGVLFLWEQGSPVLDHVMAVAVREVFDDAERPVSPVILAWDGTQWFKYGRARKDEKGQETGAKKLGLQ